MAYTGMPNKRRYRNYPTGYHTRSGVTARRIPSGLGNAYEELGVDGTAAPGYCAGKYGVQSKDFQPCVDFYRAGKQVNGSWDYHPAVEGPGFGTQVLNNLMAMFAPPPAQPQPGYVPPPATGMSQNTMIAIGLGAVGLLAVVMMARK